MVFGLILHTFRLISTSITFHSNSSVQESFCQILPNFTPGKTKKTCPDKGLEKESIDFFLSMLTKAA
jgi:hypothetical protein